jgi:serine/threonine-protein kinase
MADWNGKIIDGRYAVDALLGEGGMGVVLRARHTFTGVPAAVKLLHPRLRLQDSLAARFLAEARAPATIGHPGIVAVTDAGRTPEGDLYLVMELLQGETLKARMAREPLPFEAIRAVLLDILDALAAAHAVGLIHRDLKPDNVFLCHPGGAVKLLDFGIAKVVREGNSPDQGATTTGAVLGTLVYMSPEQLRDARQVDHRTDLWSVGIMLYEMVTGVRPYEADTFGEMVAALLSGPPRPIGERVSQGPPGLDLLLQRALAHDPRQRFASAAELAAALRALPAVPLVRRGARAATVPMGPTPTSVGAPLSAQAAPPSSQGAPMASATVVGAPLGATAPPVHPRGVPTTAMDGLMPRPHPPSLAAPTMIGPYAAPAVSAAPSSSGFYPPPPPPTTSRRARSNNTLAIGLGALAVLAVIVVAVIALSSSSSDQAGSASSGSPDKGPEELCATACARIQACGVDRDPACQSTCVASASLRACVKEAQQSADCNALAYCGLSAACGGRGPSGKGTCQAAASCEAACSLKSFRDDACLCACAEEMSSEQANRLLAQNECASMRCPAECGPSGDWTRCYGCMATACAAQIQACHDH